MKKSFWIVWIVLFLGLCSCKKNNSNEIILSFDEAYYQPLNGPLDQTFKEKLHTLLEQTHTHQGTYAEVWEILKKADADSNQTDHIVCLYTGQSIPIANQDQGLSGNYLWNREHLWPKAKGFKSEKMPAHNDCHHLHASEKNINQARSNLDFGNVSDPSQSDAFGNRWNQSYFEPRDEVKGDIARSLFYMVVRYDGDSCDRCELDLELVDGVTDTSMITSGEVGRLGDLSTLIRWHYEDPVDEAERRRNEVVFSYQKNRNPFIDHEEFVAYLYPTLAAPYLSDTIR